MTGNSKFRVTRSGTAARNTKRLDPKVRDHIGHKLKTAYQRVVDEPVPEKFLELLKQLDQKGDGE